MGAREVEKVIRFSLAKAANKWTLRRPDTENVFRLQGATPF